MVEKYYAYTKTDDKLIEKIIEDEHVAINHMVLRQAEALPLHNANSNVYMIVARGEVTLKLDAEEARTWPSGSILAIPFKTLMNVSNQAADVLEIFVVKAPSPKTMG
jgi:quercetin dioxygenase-like cupin family protein